MMPTVMLQSIYSGGDLCGRKSRKSGFKHSVSSAALRSPVAAALVMGGSMLVAPSAYAQCTLVGNGAGAAVTCAQDTVTLNSDYNPNTNYAPGSSRPRHFTGSYNAPLEVIVEDGVTISQRGLGITNVGTGGVIVQHDGVITMDTATGPAVGPGLSGDANRVAALGISAAGGDMIYRGTGDIIAMPGNNTNRSHGLSIANGGSGTVTINMDGKIESRAAAIRVTDTAAGGDISVTVGENASVGYASIGVVSESEKANVSIVSHMALSQGSIYGYAIGSGNVDITVHGDVDIPLNGSVGGTHLGSGSINITTNGHVKSGTTAIRAEAYGSGDIKITAQSVEANGGIQPLSGIRAIHRNETGTGNIDVEVKGTITGRTEGAGADLYNLGFGHIKAIFHENITGPLSLSAGATVASKGDVDVLMHKDVSARAIAVNLSTYQGGIGNIKFIGHGNYHAEQGVGLSISNAGTGNVDVEVAGLVSSGTGHAVRMLDFYIVPPPTFPFPWPEDIPPLPIDVRGGVSGRIDATFGAISALGDGADGVHISAMSPNAEIMLTVNGNVEANRTGLFTELILPPATNPLREPPSGNITLIANGDITAATGIDADNAGLGNVQVTQAAGSTITATDGHGIWAASQSGNTVVNVGGKILASAPNFAGVAGQTTSGNLTVNVAAGADIDPDYGIDLTTVDGALLVNQLGTVEGDIAAISLEATGMGTATIINGGVITSPQDAVLGVLNGGAFTFTNNDRFDGAVNVSGSNIAGSTLTNSATGTANFGSLASSFSGNLVNAGVANIGAAGNVRFLGNGNNSNRINLGAGSQLRVDGNFTNSGVINAGNNATTDRLIVGGNYSGGGQIMADFNGSAMAADQMAIGGDASGITNVVMNRIGPVAWLDDGFLPVVTVEGAAPVDAFVGSILSNGFVQESFAQNPNNAQQYGVLQTVNPNAGVLAGVSFIAEAASSALDEPMRPYITSRTDAGDKAGHLSLWMRLGGGHMDQKVRTTVAGGPLSLSSSEDVRTKFYSAQVGLDYAMLNMGGGWNMHLGVMGGWYSGDSHFANGAQVKMEAPFAGAYALIDNGGLSIEGSVRHEWRRYQAVMPSLLGNGPRDFDGSATTASVYASYRVGGATGFTATPYVGFQYASAKIDTLDIDADTRLDFRNDKSKIGRAGIRLGYRFGDEAGVTVEPFGGVSYMRNWSRGTDSQFQLGDLDTDFTARAETWRETLRYTAGLDIRAHHSRVTGFVAANFDDSKRRDGISVHAGLRYNF